MNVVLVNWNVESQLTVQKYQTYIFHNYSTYIRFLINIYCPQICFHNFYLQSRQNLFLFSRLHKINLKNSMIKIKRLIIKWAEKGTLVYFSDSTIGLNIYI